METVPPSYQSATTRDAWSIIAQYIPSRDLCAVALVCRKWHEVFMPVLWGNPASHFGTENDDVYVALTRFRRTLKYARLEVRMLTHTLHMPPALSEIYGGPRPEWLREILGYLPCLQSLMVSELPFFDHNALMALKSSEPTNETTFGAHSIRLLLASREPNTTSHSIAETLLRFRELVYLDLSYTTPARDPIVLSAISKLERLQVLKLQGLGLKDNEAEFLANAVGPRVRSLDLRHNKLTDMAVRSLMQACFMPPGSSTNRTLYPKFLRSSTLDENFIKALTQPLTGRSWVEDLPTVGITHLYIADNQITVEGAASLLYSGRLHVLDVGTVDTAKYINNGMPSLTSLPAHHRALPGAEKLIPILGAVAKENITYLRAHHPICTANLPQRQQPVSPARARELPADNSVSQFQELDPNPHLVAELPGDSIPVFELPGAPVVRLAEGEGDNGPLVRSGIRRAPTYEDDQLSMVNRGSIYAPEVLRGPHGAPGMGTDSVIQRQSMDSSGLIPRCESPASRDDPRNFKIRELLAKRPKSYTSSWKNFLEGSIPHLHPSHIPHIETLVLTDVPSHIPENSLILESLIRFITACSNEALLAILQAGTDYSLPPGQDRANAEQERARSLFALRKLILEVTPASQLAGSVGSTTWKSVSSQIGPYKSSTGDRDLEKLWSAAMEDFSFFGETECGIPENDPGKYFPMAALNEKIFLVPEDDSFERSASPVQTTLASGKPSRQNSHSQNKSKSEEPPPLPQLDLVAELAAFRRRKKLEYEQAVRHSYQRRSTCERLSPQPPSIGSARPSSPSSSPATLGMPIAPPQSIPLHVEGHWKGEVKIIRNAAPRGRSGMVDMYGNYFEKGYLYP